MRHPLPKRLSDIPLTALVLPGQNHSDGKLEGAK